MKFVVVVLAFAAIAQANKIAWDKIQPRDISPVLPGLPSIFYPKIEGRVVGGEEVVPHSRPFQVGLILSLPTGQQAFCGGSLISPSVVLTAAHCADGVQSVEVILGAHQVREEEETQVRLTSTDFVVHPKWSPLVIQNDIALIKLPQEVELNENIQVIALPSRADEENKLVDESATVSGWGKDTDSATGISPVLRQTSNNVIGNLKCSLSYPLIIRSSHLCVSGSGGKSACSGDSGGPLTVNENGSVKQVGLVSFGKALGCERGSPAVYTRLTSYLDWISENSGVAIN